MAFFYFFLFFFIFFYFLFLFFFKSTIYILVRESSPAKFTNNSVSTVRPKHKAAHA